MRGQHRYAASDTMSTIFDENRTLCSAQIEREREEEKRPNTKTTEQ